MGFSSDVVVGDFLAGVSRDLLEVELLQNATDRFRADHGGEGILAVLVLRADVFLFREKLTVLQRRKAGINHDVGFEIEDALEIFQRHVEQKTDAARQRLEEPDMRDRGCQFDMAHAIAPNARKRHLDAALLADHALVFHPLVLAAQAFVVLDGSKNTRTEQAVALGLERPVVDGLGLFDFAVRPGQNLLRARDRDLDLIEALRRRRLVEEIHDLLIHRQLLKPRRCHDRTENPAISWSERVLASRGSRPPGRARG